MSDTFTGALGLLLMATGSHNGAWGPLANGNFTDIDNRFGGVYAPSVAGNANFVVSDANGLNLFQQPSGALTGNIQYILPANQTNYSGSGIFVVTNNTTGAFTLTVICTGASAGVAVAQGDTAIIAVLPSVPAVLQLAPSARNQVGGQSTQSGWKNFVIGGDFSANPWQRVGPFTLTGTKQYTADRFWALRGGGNYVIQRTASGDPGYAFQLNAQRASGDTSTLPMELACDLPSDLSSQLAGRTCSFSIRGVIGANLSGTLSVAVSYGTGQNQTLNTGYTGQTLLISINLATGFSSSSFSTLSSSFSVPSSATQVGIAITHTPAGTAGANDFFAVTQIQLEPNSTFTGMERRPPEVEKPLCQQFTFVPDFASSTVCMGQANSATQAIYTLPFPVTMFAAPSSITFASPGNYLATQANNAKVNPSSLQLPAGGASRNSALIQGNMASGFVAGSASMLFINGLTVLTCEL